MKAKVTTMSEVKFGKATVVASVASSAGITKSKASEIVTNVYAVIRDAVLAGESVMIPGLGTLKLRAVEERTFNTALTGGQPVTVAAHKKPVLKSSVKLEA